MARNWRWSKKVGEVIFRYNHPEEGQIKHKLDLYEGIAYLIMIYEYQEDGQDLYTLHSFWVDKDHAKSCLGIDPKYKRTYGDNCHSDWESITLYRDKLGAKKTAELVGMLAKAFDELTITITNAPKEGEGA